MNRVGIGRTDPPERGKTTLSEYAPAVKRHPPPTRVDGAAQRSGQYRIDYQVRRTGEPCRSPRGAVAFRVAVPPWVRWLLVFVGACLLGFVVFMSGWSGGGGAS